MSENPPLFKKDQWVFDKSYRNDPGVVVEEPVLSAGEYWYTVRFGMRKRKLPEDQLDPFEEDDGDLKTLTINGGWGRIAAFRRALTIQRIRHKNRSTVYAYRSQRILFAPHQYKPLLKLLDSMDRRLLVADEVGLGKTIEAGMILSELEARQDMERVLVVCPSRLREKWQQELGRKFNQDFDLFASRELRQYLSQLDESPRRRRLRAIISQQTLRRTDLLEELLAAIPGLDLCIVDEAHHGRNPSALTSRMIRELGQVSSSMVLLTATPIHLGNRDLFTLLNALRPTEFSNADTFESDLQHHYPILEAASLSRSRKPEAVHEIARRIERVFGGAQGIEDPVAAEVLDALRTEPPRYRHDWVELDRRLEQLHTLSTVMTRSRKRDVEENVAVRRPTVKRCKWGEEEHRLYNELVGLAPGAGASGIGFGQIQRARQAASCLPAAIEWAHRKEQASQQPDELTTELSDLEPEDVSDFKGEEETLSPPHLVWPTGMEDAKFAALVQLLKMVREDEPGAKVLLFTYFRGTAAYLESRLNQLGWVTLRIAGDVPSTPMRPERDQRGKLVEQFRVDPKVEVLVSTEVGSEGLDFQFCHRLVNYDLPWNPMVVEQRIGRIDRFGQTAKVLNIYNLVVEGTVEDRILQRLYDRIGIFKNSIGGLESILGKQVQELAMSFVTGRLTPAEAERQADRTADAIHNKHKNILDLERSASDLVGHEDYIRDEMMRVRRLGRYMTESSLLSVVTEFLRKSHPSADLRQEEPGVHSLPVDDRLLDKVRRGAGVEATIALRHRTKKGRLYLTTDGETAFRRHDLDLVNVAHPLVVAAVHALEKSLDDPVAKVGMTRVVLAGDEDNEIPEGLTYLVVHAQAVKSLKERTMLDTVGWSEDRQGILEPEASERLLHLVMESGTEWISGGDAPRMSAEVWTTIETEVHRRTSELKRREQRENEAYYLRRDRLLKTEHEMVMTLLEGKLETAKTNQRGEGVLRMFRAQIEKARQRHLETMDRMDGARQVGVQLTEPIAVCAVHVAREDARPGD